MFKKSWVFPEDMNDILTIIGITFIPFLELRASIPYGLFQTDLSALSVFSIAVISNILLGVILYWFLNNLVHIFLRNEFINKIYQRKVIKLQQHIQKYVTRYGLLGLAIFIGVPLPGSGVYSAALGAYVLGFKFKDYLLESLIFLPINSAVTRQNILTCLNSANPQADNYI